MLNISLFSRLEEIPALLKLKLASKRYYKSYHSETFTCDNLRYCFSTLNKVSRSFATVIQQLPQELRNNVCLFYLILRALDSIEDDMNLPKNLKIKLLSELFKKNYESGWKILSVGDKKEHVELLENYDKVIEAFLAIDQENQQIITEICRRMGAGMINFVEEEITTVEDYNLYCHHVAGLVGIGLSKMFLASGLENSDFLNQEEISNSMGLFLQKTNIVRDYKEDLDEGRTFWPRDIWCIYGSEISDFALKPQHEQSISCLNQMVNDALTHATDCLAYLKNLRDKNIFKFCAIPQVMAMATLCKVYSNPEVFIKNVKIRKGLAAKIILNTTSMDEVIKIYKDMLLVIENKIPLDNTATSAETIRLVKKIRVYCNNVTDSAISSAEKGLNGHEESVLNF